jgi:hypothetical protein
MAMTKAERRQLAIENLNRGRAEQQRRREAMAQASQTPSPAARPDAVPPAADPVPATTPSPTVSLYVPTQVSINGVDYVGHVVVPRDTADTIRSLCSGAETEKKKMFDSTVHPYESIGHIE